MKKVIASASLLALGAAGAASVAVGADKPWSISASLRAFYDDNINTAPSGPGKVSSIGYEVRPSADLDYVWGPSELKASYLYSMRYYVQRRNTDQSHDFEVQFNHAISERYSFAVMDSFVIAQEPDVIAGGGAFATAVRSDGDNLRNTAGINFNAQLTELFGLVLGYGNTLYSYDENAGNTITPNQPSRSALLDRDEHRVTVDSTWTITPTTTGVFGYQFGAVDYSSAENINSPLPSPFVASSTRNNYSHSIYVGANHSFRQDFTGTVRVGIEFLDYYNAPAGQAKNSTSPYADLSLNYNYTDGGLATFGFHHAHNQTDQAASVANPGVVTVDEESSVVYLTLKQKLTPLSPRLTGSITGQYQNSVFNQGSANGETENLYLLGLDLSYQFTKLLSAETGYNYDLVTSDITGRGYNRNQIFVGISATY